MNPRWTAVLVAGLVMVIQSAAAAFTREAVSFGDEAGPYGLRTDCVLQSYNTCSGWVWIYADDAGAEWGTVFDPNDCPGGCHFHGGKVTDIWFWGHCELASPAIVNSVSVDLVDMFGCRSSGIWRSGPIDVYSCVSGNRWTHISPPGGIQCVFEEPFAITLEWGPGVPNMMKFATDNGVANLYCWLGYAGTFPGCMTAGETCLGWGLDIPAQVSYIYVTDYNGDTVMEDLCSVYGYPYPLSFPYVSGYGYMPNNLMVVVQLDCSWASAVESTSWGHVKALYE